MNQKRTYFFYSFGVDDLEIFIIQDEKEVIQKISFGTEKLTRIDHKLTFVNINISMNACKNLNKAENDNLSDTVRDFLFCSIF